MRRPPRRSSALPHCCSQSPEWTSAPSFSIASAADSIGPRQHSQRTDSPAASLSRCRWSLAVLLLAPRLLALLSLGVLRGQVLLDRGRGDPASELVERGRRGQLPRLVDALAVGVGQAGSVDEPLSDEQAQDDRERVLGSAGASERVGRLGVELPLGLRAARVADGHLALLVRRRGLLDAEPVRPRRRLAVLVQDDRAEQLDGVGVELRLPLRERRAEVEVARASGRRAPRTAAAAPAAAPPSRDRPQPRPRRSRPSRGACAPPRRSRAPRSSRPADPRATPDR